MGATAKEFLETRENNNVIADAEYIKNLIEKEERALIERPDEILLITVKWYRSNISSVSRDSLTGLFSVDSIGGGYQTYKILRKNMKEFDNFVNDNGGKEISTFISEEKEPEREQIKTINVRYKL